MSLASVRIGTWNLDHARALKHDIARLRLIDEAGSDVWVLTETNDRVALPGYSAVHSAPRPGSPAGGRWVSIWTRLPIRARIAVDDTSRSVAALLESPLGDILVFGTVLPWHTDVGEMPSAEKPKLWQEQYRVTPLQGSEWGRLGAQYPSAALCVAGDLNMNLGGPHYYGTIKGRRLLQEAMQLAGLVCTTSYARLPAGLLRHPAIDHVLLPHDLALHTTVVAAWEGALPEGPNLSDHSALVVETAKR